MQEAIDLFNKGNFVKAVILFKELASTSERNINLSKILEYILDIEIKLKGDDVLSIQNNLLSLYYDLGEHELCIKIYNKLISKKFVNTKCYLECLWEIKNLDKFDNVAQEACENILTNKIFTYASEFFEWLLSIRKWRLYPYYSSIIFHLEVQDVEKAVSLAEQLEFLVEDKWSKVENKKKSQKDYLIHLKKILDQYEYQDINFIKHQKKTKLKCACLEHENKKLNNKEVLEYIIVNANNPKTLSYLIPLIKDEVLQFEFINYIKSLSQKIHHLSDSPYSFISKYFKKEKRIMKKSLQEEVFYPASYNIEKSEDEYDEKIFEKYFSNAEERDTAVAEQHFRTLLKFENEGLEKQGSMLAVAFMEMEMYEAAKMMLRKIQQSTYTKYINAEILLKQKKYIELIEDINLVFQKNSLSEKEKIPFYYLKATAYEGLNKPSNAQNLYSIIAAINPNFRLLREKLLGE